MSGDRKAPHRGPRWQSKKINRARGHILADGAKLYDKTAGARRGDAIHIALSFICSNTERPDRL